MLAQRKKKGARGDRKDLGRVEEEPIGDSQPSPKKKKEHAQPHWKHDLEKEPLYRGAKKMGAKKNYLAGGDTSKRGAGG